MVQNRNKITTSQTKSTSRRVRTATLGSHVPKVASRPRNAEKVGFSSSRKQKRANRGFVDTVVHAPDSRRGTGSSSGRVSRREFTQDIRRQSFVRRIIVAILCLVIALGLACGVGGAAFLGLIDSKLSLIETDVASVLVDPSSDETAFYSLVAIDLTTGDSRDSSDSLSAYALVRIDTESQDITIISLPSNLKTTLSSGDTAQLSEVQSLEGSAALIETVASFAGVSISHFVSLDADDLVALVDYLGGVEVTLVEEVDDPNAGDIYIASGTQELDGVSALTLMKATNYSDGIESQSANQRALLGAVSLLLLEDSSWSFLRSLDSVADYFTTDMSALEALSLADAMRGMSSSSIMGALTPGYDSTVDEVVYYASSSTSWSEMMELVDVGDDPIVEDEIVEVEESDYTVTIRNGGGISGAAAQLSETLSALGYEVEEVGNTDLTIYTETLVIYEDSECADVAQAIVDALGIGRTVSDIGYYTFETDVLIVLGSDWIPVV